MTSTNTDRLHGKFHVRRTDGRDLPGRDKADARYFVLDYMHDEHARTALAAYADACEDDLPQLAADLRRELAATVAPSPEPEPKTPCPDGFHWIGQSLAWCDRCGLPAWEHAGLAELPKDAGPFGDDPWVLRPWKPGEAEAIRRKWIGDLHPGEVRGAGWVTPKVSR